MARKVKAPTQPSIEAERELESLVDNDKEYVVVRGKRIGFHDLNLWGLHKISKIMLKEGGDELSINCKCLAAAKLNGYFKIKFFWWILWRWYAYIKNYTDSELNEAIKLIKKKVDLASVIYCVNTTFLIGMKETIMLMNREEAEATRRELFGGKAGKSAKSGHGSQNPSESSESL